MPFARGVAASILLVAPFASAAEAPAEEKPAMPSVEETIVVTGSRIRKKELTTPAPLVILTKEEMEASGKLTLGDFLQALPAQGNATNFQVNNSDRFRGEGIQVNLRSLGRTLVLINGRRFPGQGDLSLIPAAVVERVEVLLDGASAIYGSDAIGGVVNVITRKGYKGADLSAYGGVSQHGDGLVTEASATLGQATERGNVVFSAGFFQQRAIWAGVRDFSSVHKAFNFATGETFGVGSGSIPAGRVNFSRGQVTSAPGEPLEGSKLLQDLAQAYPGVRQFMFCLPGDPNPCPYGWRPWRNNDLAPAGDGYNFQPENYLVTPHQRISFYSVGDVALGGRARAYYEASFVHRQSERKLAPEPLFTLLKGVVVSKDNHYNPFGVDVVDVRRRMVEFPNRIFADDVNSFRIVAGVDGTLPDAFGALRGFFWDVSLNFGRIQNSSYNQGLLHDTKLKDALGPSWVDSNGTPHCGAGPDNNIPNCVPLDLFHGGGSITPEQQTFGVTYVAPQRDVSQLTAIQINTAGELFRLLADQPVGFAAGYEYRLYYEANVPDPIGAAIEGVTKGGYYVNEGYAELSLPILSNVIAAQALEASAAVRAFNYSTSGWGATYKLGGRWRPIRDVTLRGTWSTAFRAPGIYQLFLGQFPGGGPDDPCAGPIDPASPRGQACGKAANNGSTDGVPTTEGGNPNLQPEKARILTAGVVFEPRFLPGFTATVDYFRIRLDQAIGHPDVGYILTQCYPAEAGTPPRYCDLIRRHPDTQEVTNVMALITNIGTVATDGIDVALRYAVPTALGRFGFSLDGVWLHAIDVQQPDGTVLNGRGNYDLGLYDFGGLNPAFKFNAGATWSQGGLKAALNTRFIGAIHECAGAVRGQDGAPPDSYGSYCTFDLDAPSGPPPYRRAVSYYNTWDAFASYTMRSPVGKTIFAAGVNNLFNTPPPTIFTAFLNYDPTAYDFIGRYFYLRATHQF